MGEPRSGERPTRDGWAGLSGATGCGARKGSRRPVVRTVQGLLTTHTLTFIYCATTRPFLSDWLTQLGALTIDLHHKKRRCEVWSRHIHDEYTKLRGWSRF